jgi:hypothetical protein
VRHAVIVHRAKSMQNTIHAVMPPLRAAFGMRDGSAAASRTAGVPHVTFLIHALAARLTSKVVALDAAKLIRAVTRRGAGVHGCAVRCGLDYWVWHWPGRR